MTAMMLATDVASTAQQPADHFIVKNGVRCAGAHLIVDLYDAKRLDDIEHIEAALRRCVEEAGATLLHINLHHFEPNGGVSGVAVLAESHISIHTWPEHGYAAVDVFMCGDAEPEKCVPVLRQAFTPKQTAVEELLRGSVLHEKGRERPAADNQPHRVMAGHDPSASTRAYYNPAAISIFR
jgi:S-adenosylmethionine decarboxylase